MPRERIINFLPAAGPVGEVTVDLWRLTVDEAREMRWKRGRETYGDGSDKFIGDPVQEAYEEMLDLLNYFDECERQFRHERFVAEWRGVVRAMAERMRYLATPPWEEYREGKASC